MPVRDHCDEEIKGSGVTFPDPVCVCYKSLREGLNHVEKAPSKL